jgi:hypothetical protein
MDYDQFMIFVVLLLCIKRFVKWGGAYMSYFLRLDLCQWDEVLNASNCVYVLISPFHKLTYIGKTTRKLNTRWKEHCWNSVKCYNGAKVHRWLNKALVGAYIPVPIWFGKDPLISEIETDCIKSINPGLNTMKKVNGKKRRSRAHEAATVTDNHCIITNAREPLVFCSKKGLFKDSSNLVSILGSLKSANIRNIEIINNTGSRWIGGWRFISHLFGFSLIKIGGKKLLLKDVRFDIENGGSWVPIDICKHLSKVDQLKGEVISLLRAPWKRKDLYGYDLDKLIYLLKGVKFIKGKRGRQIIRGIISKVIWKKFRIRARDRLVIKIPYNSAIQKKKGGLRTNS